MVNGKDREVCCVSVQQPDLSLSRLVCVRIRCNRLPEGSRESPWLGWLESLMILRAFLKHRLVYMWREDHLI